jgi:6-phosphogluconolactonase/glucosamine-6-phosphate isomerase/deaminase
LDNIAVLLSCTRLVKGHLNVNFFAIMRKMSMHYIHASKQEAAEALAEQLSASLREGKVLWLLCGGSNISLSVAAMHMLRSTLAKQGPSSLSGNLLDTLLNNLTIALTDERYGPVGHSDSNWQQLIDSGFMLEKVTTIPVLSNKSLKETVEQYNKKIEVAFANHRVVLAQFGIGGDGHIAGVLPHSEGVLDTNLICAYGSLPYVRITLTLAAFKNISIAYALVFGASKREVVKRLQTENISLEEMPSQILKQIPEAYLYTDQVEEGE